MLRFETRSYHARHHNDFEGHSNFSSTIYSVSILCAWNITTVKISSEFTNLKVKSAKCIYLLSVDLVLLFWSWTCYLGLGLKNLALFTSLLATESSVFYYAYYSVIPYEKNVISTGQKYMLVADANSRIQWFNTSTLVTV